MLMIQAQNLIAKIGDEMKSDIEHLLNDEHTPYEHELRSEDDIPDNFEEESTYS